MLEVNDGRKMKLRIFISVKKRAIGGYMKKNECKQAENYEEQWENSQVTLKIQWNIL